MKKINILRGFIIAFAVIFAFSVITYAKTTQKDIAKSVLRLHIIANSDSGQDQALKIAVRDRILEEAKGLFDSTYAPKEAEKIARENANMLEKIAKDEVLKQGFSYDVKVKIGKVAFPVKFYEDIMLPSGKYNAVQIIIGEGKGENWWCVLYPPMCLIDKVTIEQGKEKLKASLSDEEYRMLSSKTAPAKIRFKIVDTISSIM